MTQEQLRLIDYYNRFKDILNNGGTWSDQEGLRMEFIDVVKHYGSDTLRRGALLYKEFMDNGLIKDNFDLDVIDSGKTTETVSLNTDGTIGSSKVISLNPEDLDNKDNLLIEHGYNPKYFDLISAKNTKWNNGKHVNGEYVTLYSSKITVKPKPIPEDKDFFKDILDELADTYENPHELDDFLYESGSKKCLILSFNDLHWGRYISRELNSNKNYDTTNFSTIILNTMQKIVKRYKKSASEVPFESVALLLGSDFFNSDCYGKTTLHRNPQDNSMNFKDMFSSGLRLAIDLIDRATSLANNVHVVIIPGNHGNNEDYTLGKCLEAWYRTEWKVYIDADANSRKYYKFGKNLIGFTHGDKEKKNLANLMAIEKKEIWGETDTHVWITGHLHTTKETILEDNGVTIYSCPSIALDDEYTNNHGYSSEKKIMGFVFDEDDGLEEISYFKRENWSF